MRSTAWPSGAYRPHCGEGAPGTPLETISGVLHVRDTFFGHKWVYKLNESRKGRGEKIGRKVAGKFLGVVTLGVVVGLVVAATVVTVFGPKYLDKLITNNKTYNNWSYQLSSKIQNKIKLIFSIHRASSSKQNIRLKQNTTIQTHEQLQTTDKIPVPGCTSCLKSEICLQNSSAAYPECVPEKDTRDPTGCGGLCKLEVQYCKNLNSTLNIFGCIDIETLTCTENEWKCKKTLMCIPKKQICDGLIHCLDKSDELNCECDLRNNFRCGKNISCFPNSKRCDGSVDCWDASDELKCTGDCGSLNMPCYNGQCISKENWCNGNFDCNDKSDEPNGCINSNSNLTNVRDR